MQLLKQKKEDKKRQSIFKGLLFIMSFAEKNRMSKYLTPQGLISLHR